MAGKVSGFAVAYTAFGGLLIYSGVKGTSLTTTFTDLAHGKLDTAEEASAAAASTAPAAAGDTGAQGGTAEANQAIAKTLAAPYGWSSGENWADLVSLWNQESGWSNTADNPASGAYGIPQALPPTKMPAAAQAPPAGTSNASAQISWGLEYIQQRYGTPVMAWAHEEANGWY